MIRTVKQLFLAPNGQGYVGTISAEKLHKLPKSTGKLWTCTCEIDPAMGESMDTAATCAAGFLEAIGYPFTGVSFHLGRSDYDANLQNSKQGASAGVGLFLAAMAAYTQLEVRPDLSVTGVLKDTMGNVGLVEGLESKLMDPGGAGPDELVHTVLLPASEALHHSPLQIENRSRILDRFRQKYPAKLVIELPDLETLFKPGQFDHIFTLDSILLFIVRNDLLTDSAKFQNCTFSQWGSFAESLDRYVQHFFTHVYQSLESGSKTFDFDANFKDPVDNRIRDIALILLRNGDLFSLLAFFEILSRTASAEVIYGSVVVQEVVGLIQNQLNHDLHARYQQATREWDFWCDENLHGNTSINESFLKTVVNVAAQKHSLFIHAMSRMIQALQRLGLYDPMSAISLFESAPIFNAIWELYAQASTSADHGQLSLDHIVTLNIYRNLNILISEFIRQFIDQMSIQDGSVRLDPAPVAMEIKVSHDLSTMEYNIIEDVVVPRLGKDIAINGNNIIHDPVLLWPVSQTVNVGHYYRYAGHSDERCEVFNLPDGNFKESKGDEIRKVPGLIQNLFARENLFISYHSDPPIQVMWGLNYSWPPSIDSLWFTSLLSEYIQSNQPIHSILDVGAGTGFLGIFLAKTIPSIHRLCLTDITAMNRLLADYNVRLNLTAQLAQGMNYDFVTGAGLRPIISRYGGLVRPKFDVLVCAPPYLPNVESFGLFDKLGAAVAGTSLLEMVVEQGCEVAHTVYVQFSAMAYDQFEASRKRVGAKAERIGMKHVPVRIAPILPMHPQLDHRIDPSMDPSKYDRELKDYSDRVRYHEYLIENNLIQEKCERNFKYWHQLLAYRITYPSKRT